MTGQDKRDERRQAFCSSCLADAFTADVAFKLPVPLHQPAADRLKSPPFRAPFALLSLAERVLTVTEQNKTRANTT